MSERFSRSELLIGREAQNKLKDSKVIVFGIGGVGSYCAEALARGGIGRLVLVDDDRVCETNINRQLTALTDTVGKFKAEVMAKRALAINPEINAEAVIKFYGEQTAGEFELKNYDYIVDAIDTVSSKLLLIENAKAAGVPIISCMGAGNKFDPTAFRVADIYATKVCPLAKVMRSELKKRGIKALKVVYSEELSVKPDTENLSCRGHCVCPPGSARNCLYRRQVPGSLSFVPPVAGLVLAGEVIKELIGYKK